MTLVAHALDYQLNIMNPENYSTCQPLQANIYVWTHLQIS